MSPTAADVAIVRAFVRALRAAGFAVKECVWYGSRARGGANPVSDFDVIIAAPEFASLSWVRRIVAAYACWPVAHAADILCYTPEEFRRFAARASIVREAMQTGQRMPIEDWNREGTKSTKEDDEEVKNPPSPL